MLGQHLHDPRLTTAHLVVCEHADVLLLEAQLVGEQVVQALCVVDAACVPV